MRSLGYNPTKAELTEMISQVDMNHDSEISFEEFEMLIREFQKPLARLKSKKHNKVYTAKTENNLVLNV